VPSSCKDYFCKSWIKKVSQFLECPSLWSEGMTALLDASVHQNVKSGDRNLINFPAPMAYILSSQVLAQKDLAWESPWDSIRNAEFIMRGFTAVLTSLVNPSTNYDSPHWIMRRPYSSSSMT
jgi:hypothetical protein